MCVPVWQSGGRARAALLSEPVYYNAMYAFAREEDHRFDHNVESINKPDVRIIIEDNNPVQATRQLRFPLAQELSLPEVSNPADAPMSVATNKADIYFDNIVNFTKFNAVSPHKLKIVANGQPLRVFANVFAVKLGEFSFKAALDSTIESLRNSGELSVIISKYTPYMLDSQPTYAEPKNQPTS
jgi:ABC-type amino acid transport substrate-binding protein